MADIYGTHFEYGGVYSRQYGLIIANVESERMTKLAGDISDITAINKKGHRRYLIDDDISDSFLTFDVDIVTDRDVGIELSEKRQIEKWLFNRHEYRKLYFDIEDDYFGELNEIVKGLRKRMYLNCRFINPEKLEYNGGIMGYRATLVADSNMLWQDPVTKTFEFEDTDSSSVNLISLKLNTDLDDFTYPKVSFTAGSNGGTIIISNNSDDESRLTEFVDVSPETTIITDGRINYVGGDQYEKFYKRNFVRLLDGENNLSVLGDVSSITIEYQNRRFF